MEITMYQTVHRHQSDPVGYRRTNDFSERKDAERDLNRLRANSLVVYADLHQREITISDWRMISEPEEEPLQ